MTKNGKTNRERNRGAITDGPAQWYEKHGGGGWQSPRAPRLDELDAAAEIPVQPPRPTLVDQYEDEP